MIILCEYLSQIIINERDCSVLCEKSGEHYVGGHSGGRSSPLDIGRSVVVIVQFCCGYFSLFCVILSNIKKRDCTG